ncbi:MAG TPA: YbhB/YbcL family Raf kinase inhibitor-like protein [Candidatus Binatia bacterium]|nr:YbhB/YbcL family Raf kinase inhibitor-like protein [Candidatus Binatia bacterium]
MIRAVTLVAAVAAASGPMQLHSSDCPPGTPIATRTMAADCGGKNLSPSLAWSSAPAGVKSFAVIMHDADAPVAGGFYHWIVYNLPAGTTRLAAGAKLAPGQLGTNSLGKAAYYGPCPPPGPAHHYTITLYALDVPSVESEAPPTAPQLAARIEGHVLARAVVATTARTL